MKPTEILVFGASGQIGRHLLRKLVRKMFSFNDILLFTLLSTTATSAPSIKRCLNSMFVPNCPILRF